MRGKRATELAIPALAAHQHGVVSRAQLRTAGLHDRAIDRRIATGRLHPVYVKLTVAGWQILRFTWAKIMKRAEWVAAAITNRLVDFPSVCEVKAPTRRVAPGRSRTWTWAECG